LDRNTFLQEITDALDMLVHNGNPCHSGCGLVDNLHSIFNDTLQMHAPLQSLLRNIRKLLNKPWITQTLYKYIEGKNKMYLSLVKIVLKRKSSAYYKRYRNQLPHWLELSKKCDQSQFLFAKNDSAKTWKLIPYWQEEPKLPPPLPI